MGLLTDPIQQQKWIVLLASNNPVDPRKVVCLYGSTPQIFSMYCAAALHIANSKGVQD